MGKFLLAHNLQPVTHQPGLFCNPSARSVPL